MMKLNHRILRGLNAQWHRPGPFFAPGATFAETRARIVSEVKGRYLDEAAREIRYAFGIAERIVVKEPRLCVLWPLWDEALRSSGFAGQFVFLFRNPIEVAKSLQRRNEFDLERGAHLWLQYNLEALDAYCVGKVTEFVYYPDLLTHPERTLRALLHALGAEEALDAKGISELREFLISERRHHVVSAEDVDRASFVPDLAKEVYRSLLEWRSLSINEQVARIQAWRAAFDDMCLANGSYILLDGHRDRPDKPAVVPSIGQDEREGRAAETGFGDPCLGQER
jgi:hypothetical protein